MKIKFILLVICSFSFVCFAMEEEASRLSRLEEAMPSERPAQPSAEWNRQVKTFFERTNDEVLGLVPAGISRGRVENYLKGKPPVAAMTLPEKQNLINYYILYAVGTAEPVSVVQHILRLHLFEDVANDEAAMSTIVINLARQRAASYSMYPLNETIAAEEKYIKEVQQELSEIPVVSSMDVSSLAGDSRMAAKGAAPRAPSPVPRRFKPVKEHEYSAPSTGYY